MNNNVSVERKKYIKKIKKEKILIRIIQISIIIGIIALWEIMANNGVIDSFIMSSPSRIIKTFFNLSESNLLHHILVTTIETIIGFMLGTIIGGIIAIILWCSKFLSKVAEPFLVVLNSLPKVALRSNNYYMGWSWNASYYSNGAGNFFNCNHT